jgi:GrpB-like predicted nucleotidyltransferase (UPF0157 family)
MIRLMHYDPRWPQEFQQTRSSILQSCDGWVGDVHHVGSTAISGLIARPVVDCVALVTDQAGFDDASMLIEGLNFRVDEQPDWMTSGRVLVKPRAGTATHQVFLFLADDPLAQRMVRFRDAMRQNPEVAIKFEESKVHHWKHFEGDPAAYKKAKDRFFETIL